MNSQRLFPSKSADTFVSDFARSAVGEWASNPKASSDNRTWCVGDSAVSKATSRVTTSLDSEF